MISPSRRRIEIVNEPGIHLRAADQFVRLARRFQAELRVHLDGRSIDGKSVLDPAILTAGRGTRLDLVAIGPNAEMMIAALSELVEARFGEAAADEGEDLTRQPC